uniref:Bicarbonate transporter-like transmembrane domain-containing protein n=1 Tax=Arion vulgaris TaxID=1028688 RepID=A0A0B6ZC76_9EUPU
MSDFSVLIAIITMVLIDYLIHIPTPKLEVPTKFKPTRDDRGWFVNPISDKNPVWLIFAAVLPATLAVILIFMDQQITAVIVNRKENKLMKGNGYHLDMFVVAICIAICSLLGLPWYVAATVSAIAHMMSLKKESECTAPGERPTFLGVREQRVTALMVGILSGASVLFTTVLQFIPMAVLYGVFLYMGVAALKGMQFIDRLMLILKPAKYQPDYTYLRHVPIKRVHLFTIIQLICLAGLWVIKSIKELSIIFPIMVLGTCFVRKALDYIFTQRELKWLDDLMPEATKKAKEDERKKSMNDDDNQEEEDVAFLNEKYCKLIDFKISDDKYSNRIENVGPAVNVSEDDGKTVMWLQQNSDSKKPLIETENGLNSPTNMPLQDKPNGRSMISKKDEISALNGDKKKTTFFISEEEFEPKY